MHETRAIRIGIGYKGFPRESRLVRQDDFNLVFSGPKRYVNDLFTIHAKKTTFGLARLGLAIAKRCAKKAVERNRLKRIVRESFRTHREMLCQFDLVVMCRPKALIATNTELSDSLIKLWNQVERDH